MRFCFPVPAALWCLLTSVSLSAQSGAPIQSARVQSATSVQPVASAQPAAPAQPTEIFALHPRLGWIQSFYTADFRSFQGAIDCGVFSDGDGNGLALSLTGEYPLSERAFIGLGIGYMNRSGSLVNPGSFPARDTSTGNVVTVQTENTIEATLQYLELQPEFRYTIIPNFLRGPLRTVAALRFALPMTTTFTQSEKIVSPDNAAFISTGQRTQERSIASGEIYSRTSMGLGATAGVENMLRIGSNLFFTQQVLFDYNFTDVATDASWKTFGVRLEAGVRYAFMSTPPAPPEPEPIKEITVPPPTIAKVEPPPPPKPVMSIKLDEVYSGSAELEIGNELVATLPLVNAIFFEKNSASLPDRYVRQVGPPRPDDAVLAHRFILTDIAAIISKNPSAKIILQGATSGTSDEPAGKTLAENRAIAVRDALVQAGIPQNIITIKSSLLPSNPSNQDFEEGREENQRVDIVLQNAPLQEYVAQRRYAELQSVVSGRVSLENFPPDTRVTVTTNVKDTSITLASSDVFSIPFSRRINTEQSDDITIVATVTSNGMRSTDETKVPVTSLPTREVDLQVDNFEPILRFDYDKSSLSDANKDLLKQMIGKLPDGAVITILGSADALGAEKRNAELSRDRAANVEKFIRSIAGNRFQITSSGAEARFSDATPEGRFLNRSIRIRVTR